MKLLLAEPITMHAAQADSLDQLWHEAASLGTIKVDTDYKGTTYEVTIKFERKTGTRIYATGSNTNIAFAMAAAINEAREMGAGAAQ